MSNERRHPLWAPVRKILWEEWDPIGCGVPEDEYDSYVWPVVGKVHHGASLEEVANYLSEVRTETIGMGPNRDSDMAIAAKLVSLRSRD